ncbi:polysaccharide deacetylase family protein [Microbacterium sp. che218]|uniref:polysaccharide deacetylase family protein n=1 Tax=Microbacterium sp. che218 TaxID=3140649 RepID=UPI0033690E3B
MHSTRVAQRRRTSRAVRRRRSVVAAVLSVVLIAAGVTALAVTRGVARPETGSSPTAESPTPAGTPTPTPLTPAEQLLATAADPNVCAVSFEGDSLALAPQLQTIGARYEALPLPAQPGRVFAGWYADASAASTLSLIGDFDAQMAYVQDGGFYLPTWDEVSAFIDGRLYLPKRSVVVTDDDADSSWLDLAAPIVAAREVLTTSFVITSARTAPAPNPFVVQRSHTHDMHRAGANGRGRMVNDDAPTIAADLEQSAQILGAKEVVAYPYGHYDDTTKEGVRQAGFDLGRTIEHGYVRIGTDKLALPVIRVNYGMTVDDLRASIG